MKNDESFFNESIIDKNKNKDKDDNENLDMNLEYKNSNELEKVLQLNTLINTIDKLNIDDSEKSRMKLFEVTVYQKLRETRYLNSLKINDYKYMFLEDFTYLSSLNVSRLKEMGVKKFLETFKVVERCNRTIFYKHKIFNKNSNQSSEINVYEICLNNIKDLEQIEEDITEILSYSEDSYDIYIEILNNPIIRLTSLFNEIIRNKDLSNYFLGESVDEDELKSFEQDNIENLEND